MLTLINPPGLKTFSGLNMHVPNPPLGIAYIAGALRAAGHELCVIDGAGESLDSVHPYPGRKDFLMQGLALEQIVERIPGGVRMIGVTCMFSTLWPLTRDLVDCIKKKFPETPVVLGGEHGTAAFEHALSHSGVDIVVLGEGEETFLNVIRALDEGRPLSEVPGIAYLDAGEVKNTGLSARQRSVDDIALPAWDLIPINEYIERNQGHGVNLGRSMPILATRGCPYKCTFCSNPNMWTTRWIARDPKLVVDEMEKYVTEYNVSNFDFQDLTAVVKRRWIIEFCREILSRGLKITWQMPSGTRSECFDEEVADHLYRAGCRLLAFAPESGSEDMLKIVKKQVDLNRMQESIKIALRHGLHLSCFFVIGFPEETRKTLKQTLALQRKLAWTGVYDIGVAQFVPYPGSEIFKTLQAEGKLQLDDEFFLSAMDFYSQNSPSYAPAVSTRRLYWTMIWMYVNFYVISFACRPFRVSRVLLKALTTGVQETRYAKWFIDKIRVRRRWRKFEAAAAGIQNSRIDS